MFEAYNPCNGSFLVANIEHQICGLSMKTGNQQAPEQEYPLETALETHCLLKKGNNSKDHKDYVMCKEILYKLY